MELGAFSISLAVKDIAASQAFYEEFGFTKFGGDPAQNWVILKNGDHVIGLFQGMFVKNILTFNPGWDSNAQRVASFTDVRERCEDPLDYGDRRCSHGLRGPQRSGPRCTFGPARRGRSQPAGARYT
jgi:hypothetical protein